MKKLATETVLDESSRKYPEGVIDDASWRK